MINNCRYDLFSAITLIYNIRVQFLRYDPPVSCRKQIKMRSDPYIAICKAVGLDQAHLGAVKTYDSSFESNVSCEFRS